MSRTLGLGILVTMLALVFYTGMAGAVPQKGEKIESFKAIDIKNQEVDLDKIMESEPDLVILFFFTVSTGEEIALKLRRLDMLYGKKGIKIVAIGFREEEDALKGFADRLGIDYYVLKDGPEVSAEDRYGPFTTLPLTLIVTSERIVRKALAGSGEAKAEIINDIATEYFQRRDLEKAEQLAQEAIEAGEDEKAARNTIGFSLTEQGKLDEAAAEFGKVDSKEGLAKVALEKNEFDRAIEIAGQAGPGSGYAETVKGTALMRQGKLDEAAASFGKASSLPAEEWQQSEALNGQGRLLQEQGQTDDAIGSYQKAVALDPYNVVALSNEGAAHREKGNLEEAAQVLEQAQQVRGDELVTVMLQQVRREMEEANDIERTKVIQQQIQDLRKRYEELKAAGKDKPQDEWTSRPLVLALLPSEASQPLVFERAGMDVAIKREVEARIQATGGVRIVEREVLDKLLQELNLGSSELADPDTQLQLGKVLSARMLGFFDFTKLGAEPMMYLRLIDTETTALAGQVSKPIPSPDAISAIVDEVVEEVLEKATGSKPLQGLVLDAASDDEVLINLTAQHGIKPGSRFIAIANGDPVEANGKVIGYRQVKVAALEVTEVDEQWSTCKVVKKEEGKELAKEMKIKQAKAQ